MSDAEIAGKASAEIGMKQPSTLLDLFDQAVARGPSSEAVRYFDASLTYGELDAQSDALAGWLIANGVRAGDRVATMFQNTPHAVLAAVAVWKCAAVLMPCNPAYQRGELTKLFADAEPAVVLHEGRDQDRVVSALADAGSKAATLSGDGADFVTRGDPRAIPVSTETPSAFAQALRQNRRAQVRRSTHPEDAALLLYTSGTTGAPKGAVLEHRNLTFNAEICRSWFSLDRKSRILGIAPLFHITGVVCHMLAALAATCPLILTYRFQPEVVLAEIRARRPTFTIGAITAFIALMNSQEVKDHDFDSFSLIYSGGAPIPAAVADAFSARFGKPIHLSFGMTETAGPVFLNPQGVRPPMDPESGTLAVGVPVDQTEVRVVDESGAELLRGSRGELLIRGPQVMRGYWNQAVETAEALRDGWMHSGDIAVLDEQGWCYIVDRKKDMICASGFKIWPREVEDVLYEIEGVLEAVVVGKPDSYRGETVKAFLSLRSGMSMDANAVISYVRHRLAPYKCPREVEFLGDLPKTATGKLSRVALRQRAAEEALN